MHPRDEKEKLRQAIKERLSRQNDRERHAESRSLCKRILENLPPEPIAICAYYPLKDEVDMRPLLIDLLRKNHALYLPAFQDGTMVFRRIEDLNRLVPGKFGIPEPVPSSPVLDPRDLAIALIPARAFTLKGERMGRGNGGYDIWIRRQRKLNPETKFWGVALGSQIVNELPMEEHDEHVDAIVTARGVHNC